MGCGCLLCTIGACHCWCCFVNAHVAGCYAWCAQLVGFQEEVQLREQDWGNFQVLVGHAGLVVCVQDALQAADVVRWACAKLGVTCNALCFFVMALSGATWCLTKHSHALKQ